MAEHINYVTNEELCTIIRQNLYKIPHDIDGVICIPRGGLFVGTIIAEFLHKPVYTIETFLCNNVEIKLERERNIPKTNFNHYIVVDDSISSGKSFETVHKQLNSLPYRFSYIACVGAKEDMPNCDIILSVVPEFRLFELNFFHTSWTRQCIFDIDGVLCPNPGYGVDLNENEYIEHLINVKPLIPIRFGVKALCTHRLSKYYDITSKWLNNHNITYEMLYMLDFNSTEEKLRNLNSDTFRLMKTIVYNEYPDALMFVESDYNEAVSIYENTHRPVLCTDKNILLQD